ncbi:hypothetical protein Q8F55_006059 [Vanrija albida]|uniref:Uncharacterized protein n=1 Tax=Vanrija albida TaxID=181172 RepID=A0ABR3Q3C3_9TREE
MLGHLLSFVTPTPVLAPYFHPVLHSEHSTPRAATRHHERTDSADSDETVYFDSSPEFPRAPLPLPPHGQHAVPDHASLRIMAPPKSATSSIHALNAYFVDTLAIPSDEAKRLDYYSGKESLLQKAHVWRRYLLSVAAANDAREPADAPVLEAARNVQVWAAADPPYSLETWDQVTRLHLALTGAVLAWRRNPRVRARILARNVRGLYGLAPDARFVKEGLNPIRVLGEMDQRVEVAISSGPWRRHARRDNSVAACVQPMDAVVDVVSKMVEQGWVERRVLFPKGTLLAEASHEGVKREYRAFLVAQMDALRATQAAGTASSRDGERLVPGGSVVDVAAAAVDWPADLRAWRLAQRAERSAGPALSATVSGSSSDAGGVEGEPAPRFGLRAFAKATRSGSRDEATNASTASLGAPSPRKRGMWRQAAEAPPPMPGSPPLAPLADAAAKQRRILRPRTSNGGGLFRRGSGRRKDAKEPEKTRNNSLTPSTSTSASSIASSTDDSTVVSDEPVHTPKSAAKALPQRGVTKPYWTAPMTTGAGGPGGVFPIPW